MHTHKQGQVALNMLVVICDREKREKVMGEMECHKSYFNLMSLGRGTANSKILGYLGLGETEKAVFISILPVVKADELLQRLDAKMDFKKPGHGIAFTANLHEGCYHKLVQLPTPQDDGGKAMQSAHDLILVVLNRGYTEEVMDAARGAGATGGTVLHAKGCGLAGAEKFFGITIQPEKEVIMMVAGDATSCEIMSAIAENNGPGTDAGAVSFSLPVSNVMGVGSDVPQELV